MSPRDPDRRSRRINLAEPGAEPFRVHKARGTYLRPIALAAALVIVAGGLFAVRSPLGSALGAAGGGIGDAAEATVDAWRDWSHSLQDIADEVNVTTTTTTLPPVEPALSKSILVVAGSDRTDAAFALVVRTPADEVGLFMLPQSLLLLAPAYGEFTLAEILEFGGSELVELAVGNEMGIRLDEVVLLPGGLTPMADDLLVDVPVALFTEGADGSRRLIAAGRQRLSMDLVDLLLTQQGDGDQYDWLRRQVAVWASALEEISGDEAAADRLVAGVASGPELAELLKVLAAAPEVDTVPVDRVAVSATKDAFSFAGGAFLIEEFGHLLLRGGSRPRVEVLNGTGVAGATAPVAGTLVRGGFFVIRTGNADAFDYDVTQVIAQGSPAEEEAREALDLIGVGELLLELRAPSGVVDVSIIVGTDIPTGEG